MRYLFAILAALFLCAAPTQAQTLKSLMYNTNGQIVYGGTNALEFTNEMLRVPSLVYIGTNQANISASGQFLTITDGAGLPSIMSGTNLITFYDAVNWSAASNAATTRANLGFSTNLNTLWTATSASNVRNAIGLGATNDVIFNTVEVDALFISGTNGITVPSLFIQSGGISFNEPFGAAETRTNLGLGATNTVTFAGLTNNGDIRINQTTATNGLLFVYRTNNEPFLGLANLIASNNTTVSNETLFRVGVAEATNRSAQFGFRSTNTNGNGVAVFSLFGFNALMQIGADASTNAVIYSGGGTNNEVMTLIRDGATEFARPLRFSTNASTRPSTNAPANTTNVAAWVEMRIGTNSYRVPLYQ